MTLFTPGGERAVEWLFLAPDNPGLATWLAAALPHCAWTSHVVVSGPDPGGRLLETVIDFLEREPLAQVHLHLVTDAAFGSSSSINRFIRAASRFQTEAYRERTGSRLVPLPILEVAAGTDPQPAVDRSAEMAARLAKPSLLLWNEPSEEVRTRAAALGLRLYLGSRSRAESTLEVITAAHILDSTLEKMDGANQLLSPCGPHELVADGRVYACARQWRRGLSRAGIADTVSGSWRPDRGLCADCIADTVSSQGASLRANQRLSEGRELSLRISAALADRGAPQAAAELAETAVELSATDAERVDALIQHALCRLAGGNPGEADAALMTAESQGAPTGLIALHRARVQVAWRDDIEALDRFAEALEHGTDAISVQDLHFEMAMSHIRLEEWTDSRQHLELAGGPSPAISFNLGVCDVNSGRAERAMDHFDHALDLGPGADDLGRVHFFRGFCLKELGRFEEAIHDLQRSIRLEEAEAAHHNLLGFCLFKLGRHREAAESFEIAVVLDPASAIDWANLGVNLERLGKKERAAEMYRRAMELDRSIGFARDGLDRVEKG